MKPIHSTTTQQVCEIQLLFTNTEIPKNCDIKITKLEEDIWHKLTNKNQWLYIVPRVADITLSCQNHMIPQDIKLKNSGILEIQHMCKAYTPTTILASENSYESNFTSFFPEFHILDDDCCTKNKINATYLPLLLQQTKTSHVSLENLNVASHRLKDLSRLADKILEDENQQNHVTYYSFSVYIVIIIIISCFQMLYKM